MSYFHDHAYGRSSTAPPARARSALRHPAVALNRAIGNRGMAQALARKPAGQEPTVQIGKLKVTVAGGNIAEWAKGGDVPDFLEVTSQKGRHSAELERLAKDRTRIESLVLTVAPPNAEGSTIDLGSLAIQIKNGRLKRYEVDGKTETWRLTDFDAVHRTKISRKVS